MAFMGDPVTIACMINLTDSTNGGLVCAMSSTNTLYWNMEIFNGNFYYNASAESVSPLPPVVGEWSLIAITQPALFGGTPRWHRCTWPGGVPTWQHQNATGTIGPTSAPGMAGKMRIGQWGTNTSERLNGLMEVAAVWNMGLTDMQIENLSLNFANWLNPLAPLSCWRFNQPNTATALTDSTGGGANQTAIVGTSVGVGNPYFPDSSIYSPRGRFFKIF